MNSNLYDRNFSVVSESSNEAMTFSVLQWNLLADSLCAKEGDKGFELAPLESLDWSFRQQQILQQISTLSPTILCFQELDEPHFTNWLNPTLSSMGYNGIFKKKPHSLDGCALFAMAAKFSIATTRSIQYSAIHSSASNPTPQNQIAIIARLFHVNSQREMIVAVTHLKAEKSADGEDIRLQEMQQLLHELEIESRITPVAETAGGDVEPLRMPVLFAADLNATPASKEYTAKVYPFIRQHRLGFQTAYSNDSDPGQYTTWKVRKGKESKHVIDYIFHASPTNPNPRNCFLRVLKTLDTPVHVETERIPSFRYPSDHFALFAEFEMDISQVRL
ncbi:Endonuclease/exonuclease/phosphatase [Obelidium mucronatum]|nr:Endonuclease/exonuclease/phosphatase [Obelidium mucronatum]